MKNYLLLQFKRILKILPFVLIVTLCLLLGLSVFLSGIIDHFREGGSNHPITVAITGDTDNDYMQIGMGAMKTLEATHLAIVEMSESEAEYAMNTGEIQAYVIFPEDFIDKALKGEIDPVKFVTTTGSDDITTLLKNEISRLITDMVIYAEKGTYGLEDAMYDNGLKSEAYETVLAISAAYATQVLTRDNIYEVTELGISNGLNLVNYFVCGISVLLLFMMGLPYAIIHIKKDYSLNRLLLSRGHSCLSQIGCEYIAHFSAMIILSLLAFGGFAVVGSATSALASVLTNAGIVKLLFALLPIIIMLSAFNIMAFELANNIVSGMLIHFFCCLCMCYVAGCIYPIYTFPKIIQHIAEFLPTGMSVKWLSDIFTGKFSYLSLIGIIGYSAMFFGVALLVRVQKTSTKQKG